MVVFFCQWGCLPALPPVLLLVFLGGPRLLWGKGGVMKPAGTKCLLIWSDITPRFCSFVMRMRGGYRETPCGGFCCFVVDPWLAHRIGHPVPYFCVSFCLVHGCIIAVATWHASDIFLMDILLWIFFISSAAQWWPSRRDKYKDSAAG